MTAPGKPLVIPIFIPHSGCPHQCVFCNQNLITGTQCNLPDGNEISRIIREYLSFKGERVRVETAFFGGNFLGLSPDVIHQMLASVQPWIDKGVMDGIRFSTRPDTVTTDTLDLIRPYRVTMVELGAQSMNDTVLRASLRGHTARDTEVAVEMLKDHGYGTGLQLMAGLPKDTPQLLIQSALAAAALKPDIVRIYPLLVMAGSPLEKMWEKGQYQPLDLAESIRLVKAMVQVFNRHGIPVVRTGLQASDLMSDEKNVLAGPWHPAFGHLVFSALVYDDMVARIESDPDLKSASLIYIHVHPVSESRVRGDKNVNMEKLSGKYHYKKIKIIKDDRLDRSAIKVTAADEML